MSDKIQANLRPETVERVAKIANSRKTRGIDTMLNECLDNLQKLENKCGKKPQKVEGENESE